METNTETVVNPDSVLLAELKLQYDESEKDMAKLRDDPHFSWDEREALLQGQLMDSGATISKSQINTQDLTNLVFDGASRVMAQFPTGRFQAATQADKGKNLLMQMVHDKYIIPNANAQWPLMTKLKMWNVYSRVFGSMPVLVDYRIDVDYIGPDIWLIHPRSFFPQAGVVTMQQMNHCQVSTWVTVEWLESRDKEVWKNVDELIRKVREGSRTKQQMDDKFLSLNERDKETRAAATGKAAECELRTRYERGRWVTYSYEYDLIVRDIPNPQGNNELPIVMKHCFPLIDRLFGLGEFERGYTLQYAANSLVNMYFDSVKMSLYPPLILDQNGIVASSIHYEAAAKWLMTKPNSIEQLQLSPQGLNTFNSTYSFLKATLMNLGATTDTSVSKDTDPGKGKTPQALKMQEAREGARDNWDRSMMEDALEQVYNKQIDLLVTKQVAPINIDIFKKEIAQLKEAFPDEDIMTVFDSGEAGQLTVKKEHWGENVKYRFYIDAGSTMKKDEAEENTALTTIIALVLKIPGAPEQIAKEGTFKMGDKVFDFGEAFKRYVITSGIQDSEKIVKDVNDGSVEPTEQAKQAQKLDQIMADHEKMQQIIQELTQHVQKLEAKPEKPVVPYADAPEDVKRQMEQKDGYIPSKVVPDTGDEDKIRIPYKEAPEDIRRQMEEKEGFTPSVTIPDLAQEGDSHAQTINHLVGQGATGEPVDPEAMPPELAKIADEEGLEPPTPEGTENEGQVPSEPPTSPEQPGFAPTMQEPTPEQPMQGGPNIPTGEGMTPGTGQGLNIPGDDDVKQAIAEMQNFHQGERN